MDDGGDPSRNQAETQQLVEQDKALAMVYMDAPLTGQASVNYLTQKRIPVIGSEGSSKWFYESPMYFTQMSSADAVYKASMAGPALIAVPAGKTRLGVVSCVEASACSDFVQIAPAFASKVGLQFVYGAQGSLVQPDYTSYCQAALSHGVQLLITSFDSAGTTRFKRSCDGINFHPLFATASIGAAPSEASDPTMEGMLAGQATFPWMLTTNPAVVEFQKALAQYAPNVAAGGTSLAGWISAKLFELTGPNLADPPTSQQILDGLWSIKNNDLGGLTYPITFTRDQLAPQVTCYWVVQIRNGQWVAPAGGQRHCL